jgi:predicted transcriptional regulator
VLHLPIGKDKTRINVTLSKDTAKSVETLAENEKRTVSAMMAILVEEALDNRNKNKHGFIRGADYYKNIKGLDHHD